MTTTRPGYIWSGTEWVAIGQEAVVAPVSYQATEPTSPATGDIWIDSDDEVPGITSSLNYRWRKIATGGETSLSGNDTSGLPLAYNPGYEQVYLNGVLLYRGSDYVATTGNTITGLTALVAGDTIEVLSFVTAPIGDTYGQAAADAKFVSAVNNGMFLVKPTGATNGTVGANGSVTIGNAVTGVTVAGAFSAAYDNYLIMVSNTSNSTANDNMQCRLRIGTTTAASNYFGVLGYWGYTGSPGAAAQNNASAWVSVGRSLGAGDKFSYGFNLLQPFLVGKTSITSLSVTGGDLSGNYSGYHNSATSYDQFEIFPQLGTITGGTIRIYGYNNGA
jgi:hypothetical protein